MLEKEGFGAGLLIRFSISVFIASILAAVLD